MLARVIVGIEDGPFVLELLDLEHTTLFLLKESLSERRGPMTSVLRWAARLSREMSSMRHRFRKEE